MDRNSLPMAENDSSARRYKHHWYRIVTCLAAVVVFCTTYALILPAITMEKNCDIPEHTHTESCYAIVTPTVESETLAADDIASTSDAEAIPADGDAVSASEDDTTSAEEPERILVCTMQEHTHSPDCQGTSSDENTSDTVGTVSTNDQPQSEEPLCDLTAHTHDENCFDVDGTLLCTMEEHTHTEICFLPQEDSVTLTDEELEEIEVQFTERVIALEALTTLTDEDRAAADTLMTELTEAHQQGQLSDTAYTDLYNRTLAVLQRTDDNMDDVTAEPCYGDNWIKLRDSGWFEEYSDVGNYSTALLSASDTSTDTNPSAVQIDDFGGTTSNDDGVTVSKTITGTGLENVFDITLTVETPQRIDDVITEPDMAVVIVMDISNTMNENFGGTTRYAAAVSAAEDFLDNFADNNNLGVSKVGYVAFNTNAHKIFDLSPCTNQTQADALKNTMRTATGDIINQTGYGKSHSRFTNVEAGLKMASDMLDKVSNKNKFIIFLSDGFPTTYIENGYNGYDPYDEAGTRFYDTILELPCSKGTSYSNEAAIRARTMASTIKSNGTTIFSIGVDIGGQTIEKYVKQSETQATKEEKFSIVDRRNTTYEIGDASSADAYKNWLGTSIGSGNGYYYDSTNAAGLKSAYEQIFARIKTTVEATTQADWVTTDPIPGISSTPPGKIEFIGMYDKANALQQTLTGSHTESGENDADYDDENTAISWDLKKSGYTVNTDGNTTYTYQLTYRVRLQNEEVGFVENQIYKTNNVTTLQYRIVQKVNDTLTISNSKTIEFPIPSVHGYLCELTFTKKDNRGNAVADVEFTLHHADVCNICRGDGETQVEIADMTATSDANGTVKFTAIPSGHIYTLTETKIPDGYYSDGSKDYVVTVAYDKVTVTFTKADGTTETWTDTGGTRSHTSRRHRRYRVPEERRAK